jgi:hypothetical protein
MDTRRTQVLAFLAVFLQSWLAFVDWREQLNAGDQLILRRIANLHGGDAHFKSGQGDGDGGRGWRFSDQYPTSWATESRWRRLCPRAKDFSIRVHAADLTLWPFVCGHLHFNAGNRAWTQLWVQFLPTRKLCRLAQRLSWNLSEATRGSAWHCSSHSDGNG